MSVDCFYMVVSSLRWFQNIICCSCFGCRIIHIAIPQKKIWMGNIFNCNKYIINPKGAMHAIIEASYFTHIVWAKLLSMITHPHFMHEIVILHTPFCEANYGIYK